MINVLVIGLGNIGALYDWDSENIYTHVKAFSTLPNCNLYVHDVDVIKTQMVSNRYKTGVLNAIDKKSLGSFNCVSICTPNNTHGYYLKMAFDAGVKLIICEKPLSIKWDALEIMKSYYLQSSSKVIVNLFRRFQPAYNNLKERIAAILTHDELQQLSITYQNGFLNNCIHAFDLIEFIFDKELTLSHIKPIQAYQKCKFLTSFQAKWQNVLVKVIEIEPQNPPVFNIDLHFRFHSIMLTNSSNNIQIIYKPDAASNDAHIQQENFTNCISNYMLPVIHYAQTQLHNKQSQDNFLNTVALNKKMINYYSKLACQN